MTLAAMSHDPAEPSAPRAPRFFDPPQRAPEPDVLPLGARARRMLRRLVLADHSREGLIRMVDQLVARPLASLIRIVPLIILVGPKARRDLGLPIWRQLVGLLRMVLVHGAKPAVYYLMECYRPDGDRRAAATIHRNEVKHGVVKALNRIDPDWRKHRVNIGDKLGAARWFSEHGLPNARPLLLVEVGGKFVWQNSSEADLDRDLFLKRQDGRGAYHATRYLRIAPFRYRDKYDREVDLAQLMDELKRRTTQGTDGKVRSWMVVPFLHTHPAIADLTGDSLLAFRTHTCLDEQLRPVLTNAYLRSISKLEPRWDVGRIEEFAAPIDLDTGALGLMSADKPECLSERFDHHPVTGAKVTGRVVPFFRELLQLSVKAHSLLPGRVWIGWDIAITEQGPVFLEGNSFADPLFPQRVYDAPFGDMRLGELLSFHLGRLEAQLDANKRH